MSETEAGEWNPLAVIEAADTGGKETKAAASAVLAYLSLLWMPHGVLRSLPEAQAALSHCRDLVSAACSVDQEIVQNACELFAASNKPPESN